MSVLSDRKDNGERFHGKPPLRELYRQIGDTPNRGQTGLTADFRQTSPEIHVSLVRSEGQRRALSWQTPLEGIVPPNRGHAKPGTDRTDSGFPANFARNPCQSCLSPGVTSSSGPEQAPQREQ